MVYPLRKIEQLLDGLLMDDVERMHLAVGKEMGLQGESGNGAWRTWAIFTSPYFLGLSLGTWACCQWRKS